MPREVYLVQRVVNRPRASQAIAPIQARRRAPDGIARLAGIFPVVTAKQPYKNRPHQTAISGTKMPHDNRAETAVGAAAGAGSLITRRPKSVINIMRASM